MGAGQRQLSLQQGGVGDMGLISGNPGVGYRVGELPGV